MPLPLEIHLFKFQGEGREALMNIIQFQFLKMYLYPQFIKVLDTLLY